MRLAEKLQAFDAIEEVLVEYMLRNDENRQERAAKCRPALKILAAIEAEILAEEAAHAALVAKEYER